MTREEQINQASIDTFKVDFPFRFGEEFCKKYIAELRRAFTLGATWADNHPFVDMFLCPEREVEDLNLSENDA